MVKHLGWGDIFQVDSTERWLEDLDGSDQFFRIIRIQADWEGIDAPRYLKRRALPSMVGKAASGPIFPSPRTRDPSETTATVFHLLV